MEVQEKSHVGLGGARGGARGGGSREEGPVRLPGRHRAETAHSRQR